MDDLDSIKLVIADYKADFVMPKRTFANRAVFERYSVINWACEELLDYIFEHWLEQDIIEILAAFRSKIYRYMRMSERTRKIFLIVLDVTDDIEDMLCGIVS